MHVIDEAADRAVDQAAVILYVLAAPRPGVGSPVYLLHDVGGVSCVIAFTDLARLVAGCGEHQPWLGIKITALMADLREQGLPGPVVNVPLNPALWWTADGPPYRILATDRLGGDLAGTAVPTARGAFA